MRLNVPQEGRKTTISDCLKRAAATETPEGYACESCGKKDVTSKRERIKSWSKYLLLNCDRVVRKGKVGTKIPIPRYVNLDEHMLDYQPSTSDVGKKMANLFPEFRYEVVAFAEHDGATYVVPAVVEALLILEIQTQGRALYSNHTEIRQGVVSLRRRKSIANGKRKGSPGHNGDLHYPEEMLKGLREVDSCIARSMALALSLRKSASGSTDFGVCRQSQQVHWPFQISETPARLV